MAPEKCVADPSRDCLGLAKAEMLEKQIAEKEEQLEELRQKRFDPEYYHDYQKMNELDEQIDDLHNEIEHLMQRWEECLEG